MSDDGPGVATLDEGEDVVVEATDGTRLVRRADGGGTVLERYDDPDFGEIDERVDWDEYADAELHMALWVAADRFDRPERSSTRFVPTDLVALGTPYVSAWLYLNGCYGTPGSRQAVADRLDVTQGTVNRHLSQVRETVTRTGGNGD